MITTEKRNELVQFGGIKLPKEQTALTLNRSLIDEEWKELNVDYKQVFSIGLWKLTIN
jgi:hypothetical protein